MRVMWGYDWRDPSFPKLRDSFDKKKAIGPRMVIASTIFDGDPAIWPRSLSLSNVDDARREVRKAKSSGADFVMVYSRLPRGVFVAIANERPKPRTHRGGSQKPPQPTILLAQKRYSRSSPRM